MSRFSDHPTPLGDVLRGVARRVKKVDLTVMDEVRALWPTLVDDSTAHVCQPEFVKDQTLVISVPSGAYARHVMLEKEAILSGLAVLGSRAPRLIKTIQKAQK